jgi:hypothetical protein
MIAMTLSRKSWYTTACALRGRHRGARTKGLASWLTLEGVKPEGPGTGYNGQQRRGRRESATRIATLVGCGDPMRCSQSIRLGEIGDVRANALLETANPSAT